jgi:stage II sporulation protein D
MRRGRADSAGARWPAAASSPVGLATAGPRAVRFAMTGIALLGWSCAGSPPPDPPAPQEPSRAEPRRARPPPVDPRAARQPAGASAATRIDELITSEPLIRVGIEVGTPSAVIMSTAGLRVRDGVSGEELLSAGEEILRFEPSAGGASLVEPAGRVDQASPSFIVEPLEDGADVVIAGKTYRGAAEVVAHRSRGLIVINRLGLEDYLLGVVPAEIGRRAPEEFAAVRAQAVAARTYTISQLGRRDSLGFDLFATVEDQVYGGLEAERSDVERAINETRGEILVFDGQPVSAFYHSTCGGRTATREEVWGEPNLPYLRSVRDAGGGEDFCAISPRYRWRESWTADEMNGFVRAELASRLGVSPSSLGRILGIRVLSRTEADRVDQLEVEASGGRYVIRKNEIRWVLQPSEGRILGSTDFVVRQGRLADGEIVVEGRGYGHGIGMCQWGAIGRARAGQGYREILAAYYQDVAFQRLY